MVGMALGAIRSRGRKVRFRSFLARPGRADLTVFRELIEAGKVKPLIDRAYPLDEIREAVRHSETFHARGKVVVTI